MSQDHFVVVGSWKKEMQQEGRANYLTNLRIPKPTSLLCGTSKPSNGPNGLYNKDQKAEQNCFLEI